MVEEQVAEELVRAQGESHLPADESEALAELEQELADVLEQLALEVALQLGFGDAEDVEEVRVLGGLLDHVESSGGRASPTLLMAFPRRSCSRLSI